MVAISKRTVDEPQQIPIRFRVNQAQQPIFDVQSDINFHGRLLSRTVAEIQGFLIPAPGDLLAQIVRDEVVLTEWTFAAHQVGAPQADLFNAPQPPALPAGG
jgi:hypothetical protein